LCIAPGSLGKRGSSIIGNKIGLEVVVVVVAAGVWDESTFLPCEISTFSIHI